MEVSKYISEILERGRIVHITLIDPEKQRPLQTVKLAKIAESENTDLIMVGGSSHLYSNIIAETIKKVKENINLPIVQIIRDGSEIEESVDCVVLPVVMNSVDPHFCLGLSISASRLLKNLRIEAIPIGYIIVNPGGTAGWVTKSQLIPRNKTSIAIDCAVAAETIGLKYVYLEAGHVGQNIYLQAESLGLGTVSVGAFDEEEIIKILNLPPTHKPLYVMPIGYPI